MSDSSLVSERKRRIVNTALSGIYTLYLLRGDALWLTLLDVCRGRRRSGDEPWRQVRVPAAVLPSCLTSACLQTNDLFLRLPRSGSQILRLWALTVLTGSVLFDVAPSYPATSRPISRLLSCVSIPGLPAADKTHMGGEGGL